MPARRREIGPEVSTKIAAVLLRERKAAGWERSDLSRALEARGYKMTIATIRHIEQGVTEGNGRDYRRMISADELRAFMEVMGTAFTWDVITLLTEDK